MAKIQEEVVVIKFSKLIKDGDSAQLVATSDITTALEQVAQELAGAGVIVEVEKA